MKAMVLAAGEGTRLRPLTLTTPKPMIPIGNIPLLERTLRWLAREGVTDVMINLYHLPQLIVDFVGSGRLFGVNVSYSLETTLLGTAGAVKNCQEYFGTEPFVVIYGDNLLDIQLQPLIDRQLETKADAVIGLFVAPNPSACGLVLTESNGQITRFQEKPAPEEVFTDQANAGVYILAETVFEYIPDEEPYDFGRQVFPQMLQSGCNLQGVVVNGYIQDTGTPESYRRANEDVLTGAIVGVRGKLIANNPNFTLIGERTHLSPGVTFRGINIVGPGSRIGARAELVDTIVWDGVRIPDDLKLSGAIIGSGVKLEPGNPVDDYSLVALDHFVNSK